MLNLCHFSCEVDDLQRRAAAAEAERDAAAAIAASAPQDPPASSADERLPHSGSSAPFGPLPRPGGRGRGSRQQQHMGPVAAAGSTSTAAATSSSRPWTPAAQLPGASRFVRPGATFSRPGTSYGGTGGGGGGGFPGGGDANRLQLDQSLDAASLFLFPDGGSGQQNPRLGPAQKAAPKANPPVPPRQRQPQALQPTATSPSAVTEPPVAQRTDGNVADARAAEFLHRFPNSPVADVLRQRLSDSGSVASRGSGGRASGGGNPRGSFRASRSSRWSAVSGVGASGGAEVCRSTNGESSGGAEASAQEQPGMDSEGAQHATLPTTSGNRMVWSDAASAAAGLPLVPPEASALSPQLPPRLEAPQAAQQQQEPSEPRHTPADSLLSLVRTSSASASGSGERAPTGASDLPFGSVPFGSVLALPGALPPPQGMSPREGGVLTLQLSDVASFDEDLPGSLRRSRSWPATVPTPGDASAAVQQLAAGQADSTPSPASGTNGEATLQRQLKAAQQLAMGSSQHQVLQQGPQRRDDAAPSLRRDSAPFMGRTGIVPERKRRSLFRCNTTIQFRNHCPRSGAG